MLRKLAPSLQFHIAGKDSFAFRGGITHLNIQKLPLLYFQMDDYGLGA